MGAAVILAPSTKSRLAGMSKNLRGVMSSGGGLLHTI